MFERAIVGVVKQHQDRHHLAEMHLPRTITVRLGIFQQRLFELRLEIDDKLVQIVEQCFNAHGGLLAGKLLKSWSMTKVVGPARPPFQISGLSRTDVN